MSTLDRKFVGEGGILNMPAYRSLTSEFLKFYKNNTLNITDITRSSRLTEILNSFSTAIPNEEVFIVQNTKIKNAQAVLADLDYFEELLMYKEAVELAMDEVVYQMTLERKDEIANIPMAKLIEDNNLDFDRILSLVDDEDFE